MVLLNVDTFPAALGEESDVVGDPGVGGHDGRCRGFV